MSDKRRLVLLVALACAVRLVPIMVRFVISTDEGLYLALGQNLAAGQGYHDGGGVTQVDFPPGYPLFAAAVYALGGGLELPSQLNLVVAGGLLPLAVYALAQRVAGERVAWRAGLLAALLPALVLGQTNFEAAAEQGYSLFLYAGWAALAACMWNETSENTLARRQTERASNVSPQPPPLAGGTRSLILLAGLAGLALGVAHLTRWEGLVLGLLGAGAMVIAAMWRIAHRLPLCTTVAALALYLSALGLFAIPYGFWLYEHTGSFASPKTTITRLHGAALDSPDPLALEKTYDVYERYLADPHHPPSPTELGAPGPLVERYARNVWLELRLFFTSASLMAALWIVPALIGLVTLPRGRALYLALLFVPLAAIPASVVDTRYFVPPLPAAMVFAAAGWVWLQERLNGRGPTLRRALDAAFVLLLVVFLTADLVGPFLYPRPVEYRQAGLTLREQLPAGAHILARKRQVAFYAGAVWEWLPFADLDGVLAYAEAHDADYFVVDDYTTPELRPQLAYLLDPAAAPAGLEVVYHNPAGPGRVVVYRIRR